MAQRYCVRGFPEGSNPREVHTVISQIPGAHDIRVDRRICFFRSQYEVEYISKSFNGCSLVIKRDEWMEKPLEKRRPRQPLDPRQPPDLHSVRAHVPVPETPLLDKFCGDLSRELSSSRSNNKTIVRSQLLLSYPRSGVRPGPPYAYLVFGLQLAATKRSIFNFIDTISGGCYETLGDERRKQPDYEAGTAYRGYMKIADGCHLVKEMRKNGVFQIRVGVSYMEKMEGGQVQVELGCVSEIERCKRYIIGVMILRLKNTLEEAKSDWPTMAERNATFGDTYDRAPQSCKGLNTSNESKKENNDLPVPASPDLPDPPRQPSKERPPRTSEEPLHKKQKMDESLPDAASKSRKRTGKLRIARSFSTIRVGGDEPMEQLVMVSSDEEDYQTPVSEEACESSRASKEAFSLLEALAPSIFGRSPHERRYISRIFRVLVDQTLDVPATNVKLDDKDPLSSLIRDSP